MKTASKAATAAAQLVAQEAVQAPLVVRKLEEALDMLSVSVPALVMTAAPAAVAGMAVVAVAVHKPSRLLIMVLVIVMAVAAAPAMCGRLPRPLPLLRDTVSLLLTISPMRRP